MDSQPFRPIYNPLPIADTDIPEAPYHIGIQNCRRGRPLVQHCSTQGDKAELYRTCLRVQDHKGILRRTVRVS